MIQLKISGLQKKIYYQTKRVTHFKHHHISLHIIGFVSVGFNLLHKILLKKNPIQWLTDINTGNTGILFVANTIQ